MRTFLALLGGLSFLPVLTPAGTAIRAGRFPVYNHHTRAHFENGTQRHRFAHSGYYYFTGVSWVFVVVPDAGVGVGDDVYQAVDDSGDTYPYAEPTSNPNIVISPFAPNYMVDVSGIPPGAKVKDPVSGQIFLRP
jgi:hypothetical protein